MAQPVPFLEDFDAVLPGAGTGWLDRLRADAQEAFRKSGLPTPRTEAWKYTNLRRLARTGFVAAEANQTIEVTTVPEGIVALEDAYVAVFVNGRFAPSLSSLDGLSEGVEATSLAAKLSADRTSLEGQFSDVTDLPMATLNTGLLSDGLYLKLDDGVALDKPLHLVSIGTAGEEPVSFHPRHLITAGAGSVATIVESHVGSGAYFSNSVSEISVGDGAVLNHYKLQNEGPEAYHLAANLVRIADRAVYDNFVLQVGGNLARNEIRSELGERVECRLNGAYLACGEQHIDNTTFIAHAPPNSSSREVYKGVLDESARGVFQGKILVRQDSQKTDGHQLNKTLLLSPGTEIDTKPELEIYADDVKCSHGATTGELEEEPLFYLRARGIDPQTARGMLVAAFVGEALDEIQTEAPRAAFQAVVDDWLESRSERQG
ncbi:MAG: Fe-S cluster assembly protein SufD [Rhodospirillaceae bacterium]|nr:Fe-S cluster assembly protein SufD [Rhodospirillaceae bacterium]